MPKNQTEYEEFAGTKTERKKPVPQKYEAIEKGALKLPLAERVHLTNTLKVSIHEEVKAKEEDFQNASRLVNGVEK